MQTQRRSAENLKKKRIKEWGKTPASRAYRPKAKPHPVGAECIGGRKLRHWPQPDQRKRERQECRRQEQETNTKIIIGMLRASNCWIQREG